MMKKPILTALLSLLVLSTTVRVADANTQNVYDGGTATYDGPISKALPISDPNVTGTAARLRLTKGAWDYLRITIRDTFNQWGTPHLDSAGANLILDPGYDFQTHGTAGLMRTTPMLWDWVRYDTISRPVNYETCNWSNCIGGGESRSVQCGYACNKTNKRAPSNLWLQVRRPGTLAGYPSIPTQVRPHFRENGFYIAKGTNAFYQLQFCTTYYGSKDAGSGDTGACGATLNDVALGIDLDYSIRLFLYPNSHVEHERVDTVGGSRPAMDNWTPTVKRGSYYGLDSLSAYLVGEYFDCPTGHYCVVDGKHDCVWPLSDKNKYRPVCNPLNGYVRYDTWMKNLPTTASGYNSSSSYNRLSGTYFRGGDDQALYINYKQMQVHSVNRSSFNGTRGCGPDHFYTGQLDGNGKPRYIRANTPVANCVLPKSYWSFEENRWQACRPFDTWNADGSYNIDNDDNKWLYPGHPDTGGYSSPGRCGAQPPCDNAACTTINGGTPRPANYRLTNMENRFAPGGGWYMLSLDQFQLFGGTDPRIEIKLSAPDIRLELAAAADLRLSDMPWPLPDVSNNPNRRIMGYVGFHSLEVDATLRIFSVDDSSCTPANPAACEDVFNQFNDGKLNPSRLTFEATVQDLRLNRTDPFVFPSADCPDDVSLDAGILGSIDFSFCDVLNDDVTILGIGIPLGVPDMLIPIIEDALTDMIAPFLEEFAAEIPNLNSVLGDPINMGTALIDNGIYAVGGNYPGAYKTMPDGTVRWPVFMQPGPTANSEAADLRLSLGFKPLAFRPPVGPNNVMDIDNNDPPLPDSVFGVPTLMNPDTTGCGGNCSLGSHPATRDVDQVIDGNDYVTGASGTYINPKTGGQVTLGQYARIPEYFSGPIPEDKRPPSWCLSADGVAGPRTLRSNGGTAADFAALYPRTTWPSFHPTYDPAPVGSGMITPGSRATIGAWDEVPGNYVFQQNANDWNSREPNPVRYDFSLHLHQRSIAQFLQAVFASGAGCLEFAAQDTTGADTPWKDLLATERFSAFIPEVASLFPGRYMKVRLTPTATPRVRTGLGNLDFVPQAGDNPAEAPLPMRGPYSLSIAVPDIKLDFVLDDPEGGEVSVLTMYWTPVLGLHVQSVRRCFHLDPLFNDPQCTSPYVNVRTVSGYYEIYVDLNSETLINDWENGTDFPAGYFSDIGTTRGSSSVVIERTFCDGSARCNRMGISQAVPTLMNSFVSLFFVSRMNFANFTIDALYVGPDGPNDDGIGQGDYLGVYARFLGNLNVFSLLETAALLSPPGSIEPKALVPLAERQTWFGSTSPKIPVQSFGSFAHLGKETRVGYTWSLDGGFWHTPENDEAISLSGLTEGQHTLKVRAVEYTDAGPKVALEASDYTFRVDTVAPRIDLRGGTGGAPITVDVSDAQASRDAITVEYTWDGDDWMTLTGDTVPLRGLTRGEHVLQVRARDAAGNESGARMHYNGGEAPWWERTFGISCGQAKSGDIGGLLLAGVLTVLAWRRRERSR